jgi:hypothetical protein
MALSATNLIVLISISVTVSKLLKISNVFSVLETEVKFYTVYIGMNCSETLQKLKE